MLTANSCLFRRCLRKFNVLPEQLTLLTFEIARLQAFSAREGDLRPMNRNTRLLFRANLLSPYTAGNFHRGLSILSLVAVGLATLAAGWLLVMSDQVEPVSGEEFPLYGIDTGTDALYMLDRVTGDRTLFGRLDPSGHPDTNLAPNRFVTPTGLTYDTFTDTILVWNNSACVDDFGAQCVSANVRTSGDLVEVDPMTGVGTPIGSETGQILSDIVFDPVTGQLFGIGASLWTIDRDTAAIAEIGRIRIEGSAGFTASGAAFAPDGTLYALQLVSTFPQPDALAKLVTIDTSTASATVVGEIPSVGLSGAIAFLDDGTLLGSAFSIGMLFDIDPATGVVTNPRGDDMAQGMTSPVTARPSSDDYALEFDGLDDVARMTDITGDLDFDENFTVEARVWPYSVDTEGAFRAFVRGSSSTVFPPPGGSWILFQDFRDGSDFGLSVCGPSCNAAKSGPGALAPGQWHHVAGTYDGATVRAYLNGVEIGAQPHSGNVTDVTWIILGLWSGTFDGVIDEVRLWDITRSEVEILASKDSSLTGSEPGLVGYWPLDDGIGQTFADVSGKGNPGLLGLTEGPDEADPRWILVDDLSMPGPDTGTVTIVKSTNPPGGTNFGFASDIPGAANFTLDDGGSLILNDVPAGPYAITLDDPAPSYVLDSIVCVGDREAATNVSARLVTIDVDAGEDIVCTFSSTLQSGSITIANFTLALGGTGFGYTSDIPGHTNFSLDHGGLLVLDPVQAGTYSVTLGDHAPQYRLEAITCVGDPGTVVHFPSRTVTIDLDAGEAVTCAFTSTRQTGDITISNFTAPPGETGFGYTSDIPGGETFALNDGDSISFPDLLRGDYTVTLDDHSPLYLLESITCIGDSGVTTDLANRTVTIDLDTEEDVTCSFGITRQTGDVAIVKTTVPPGGVDFSFVSDAPGSERFSLNDGEMRSVVSQPAGPYQVTMDNPSPWYQLQSISCLGDPGALVSVAGRSVLIDLDAGENVTCEFISAAAPPTPVTAPLVDTGPVLDGVLTFGEWGTSPATTVDLASGFVGFVRDTSRLYVLLDVLEDSANDPANDRFSLALDINGDGLPTPGVDMLYALIPGDGNMRYAMWPETGMFPAFQPTTRSARASGFGCFLSDGSMNISRFNFSCSAHRLWEIGIDLEELGINGVSPDSDVVVRMGITLVSGTPDIVEEFPEPFLFNFASMMEISLEAPTDHLLAVPGPGLVMEADSVEVTQAIQTRDNSLPLASGKQTWARAYVTLDGPGSIYPARVFLHASKDGTDLPGSPLLILDQLRTPLLRSDINRNNADETVNFELPESWADGNVQFSLVARDLFGNELVGTPTTVTFAETEVPTIWIVPLNEGTAASPVVPTEADMERSMGFVEATYPVKEVNWVFKPWDVVPVRFERDGLGFWDYMDVRLADLDAYYNAIAIAWTLGIIANGVEPFDLPDQIAGFHPAAGGISSPTWVGGRGFVTVSGGSFDGGTLAHEINHNLDTESEDPTWGLHVGNPDCDGWEGPYPTPSDSFIPAGCDIQIRGSWRTFPDEEGWWVKLEDPVWGCGTSGDAVWPVPPNDDHIRETGFGAIAIPDVYPDFMSYCWVPDPYSTVRDPVAAEPESWISPYRWLNLLETLAVGGAVSAAAGESVSPIAGAAADGFDVFYVSGQVTSKGKGSLNPITIQPGILSPSPISGDYALEFENSLGDVVMTVPFMASFVNVEGEDRKTAFFNYTLPAVDDVQVVRLVRGADILDEIVVSDNPPVVNVISPNGGEVWNTVHNVEWSAGDADKDSLTFTVLYTPDDGASWFPVVFNLTETSFAVDSASLPGGSSAGFRVIATDGYNTTHDDSDGFFTVAAKVPDVEIHLPNDGDVVAVGDTTVLSGTASDAEDGDLSGLSLIWMVDGVNAGVGAEISVSLTNGIHSITLAAIDRDGNTSTAAVSVQAAHRPTVSLVATPDSGSAPLSVDFTASAGDADGDIAGFRWDFNSDGEVDLVTTGSTGSYLYFSHGSYMATVEVYDSLGLTASTSAQIIATCDGPDVVAPVITASVSPVVLWPPNHSYAAISLSVDAIDNCSDEVTLRAHVTSSEPDSSSGKKRRGDKAGDIRVTTESGDVLRSSNATPVVEFDPLVDQLELRAERLGSGDGRTYWITVTAVDVAGNTSEQILSVTVPHDSS